MFPPGTLPAFVLVTSLFALWGFANDITNPMVAAFKNVLLLSHFQSSLVQAAFYGGYCFMAIPAALFIRRFSYKGGILTGLALYSVGCFLFLPAGSAMDFGFFLAAYFVMTCGLAFLETTANPYILSLGPEETAARRLNFAQAFNPMGSLLGMFVAKDFILARLHPADEETRRVMAGTEPNAFAALVESDLSVIVLPYVLLGGVVLAVFIGFLLFRLPETRLSDGPRPPLLSSLSRLFQTPRWLGGVVAQAFYVGVQIMLWTFVIQYAINELGMTKTTAQGWNIAAMVLFVSSRFVCTWLLKFFNPGALLAVLALGGIGCLGTLIFVGGWPGLYALVAASGCMSLMFPTIYGIALRGLGEDAKLGSAGLICAIGGGALMPPLQALLMDGKGVDLAGILISATRFSFVLPLICFVVIAAYGWATFAVDRRQLPHQG
ncbi:MAG: L-fucose:H+ symporter permease [Candidatus Methylacidiphilales bacterium]